VLALYMWLAPTHIVDGDNAEFATLGALGGAAHPPGYPLYVLYLRAMSWLPGASPAHTAALATAILGAASIVVLHAACRAWGARPLAATVACAVFAGAPVVMTLYTEAEVFALNGLVVAGLLLLSAEHAPLRGVKRLVALGLVAGLGLSNHHTCVLLAPVGLLGVVRGARESSWRAAPLAAIAFVLGLVPYLYLLVAPVHARSWGDLHSLHDVIDMFLRRDYGGPGAFAVQDDHVTLGQTLGALAHTVGRTWLWGGAIAALASVIARVARPSDPARESRWGWAMLLATIVLAGPLLAARFNIKPEGVGLYVVNRFHILPALLLAIPFADAIDRLGPYLRARSDLLTGPVAVATFAAIAGTALPHVVRVHSPAVELQVLNTLRSLPGGAVMVGWDDDIGFGVSYAQLALAVRPDIDYVHRPTLSMAWYRKRVAERFRLDGIIDDALAKGRPVFVQPKKEILSELPYYPYGILARVLPKGSHTPSVPEVVEINKQVYAQFDLSYARPGPDDEWPTAVHERYARPWLLIASALEQIGRPDDAAWARDVAKDMGPER
jgi:hypothetical protein